MAATSTNRPGSSHQRCWDEAPLLERGSPRTRSWRHHPGTDGACHHPHVQIVIVVFDGVDALDALGAHDVLRRLPDSVVRLAAPGARATVETEGGVALVVDSALQDAPWPDVAVLPGGAGDRLPFDDETLGWLRSSHVGGAWLGAANAGASVVSAALEEGAQRVVLAQGQTAGIELGLLLAAAVAGEGAARAVRAAVIDGPGRRGPMRPYPGFRR